MVVREIRNVYNFTRVADELGGKYRLDYWNMTREDWMKVLRELEKERRLVILEVREDYVRVGMFFRWDEYQEIFEKGGRRA